VTLPDPFPIQPIDRPIDVTIYVPGSKSITNRALILAALADGQTILENALVSDDSRYCAEGLRQLGFSVSAESIDEATARFMIDGQRGRIPATEADLFVGNSGTTARFLTAMVCLGKGTYRLDGVARMRERPIAPLIDALRELGAHIEATGIAAHFPLTIHADELSGGLTHLDASASSQYLSALLMAAPYAHAPIKIELTGTPVSEPYIATTIRMMAQFGVVVSTAGDRQFTVPAGVYRGRRYIVEPDASNASYFFAAAAVTGGKVRVPHLMRDSLQGDIRFLDVLAAMGCTVEYNADAVTVTGPTQLHGLEVDMNAISDTAQTLAAIAPYADAPVTIRNIAHVRHKETDRLHAMATELTRLGASVTEF